MSFGIAGGAHDGRGTFPGEGGKPVRVVGGENCVDRDFQVTVRAVFEADRHGQSRSEFAVHLAFDSAGADGSPADDVGVELPQRGIEKLGADGQTFGADVDQELAADAQALVDLVRSVASRVVDESLPADHGAGFFEINPHDNQQVLPMSFSDRSQQISVVERGGGVMNRAWPRDNEQMIVFTLHDGGDFAAGLRDLFAGSIRQRDLFGEQAGSDEWFGGADAQVGGFRHRKRERGSPNGAWQGAGFPASRFIRIVLLPVRLAAGLFLFLLRGPPQMGWIL